MVSWDGWMSPPKMTFASHDFTMRFVSDEIAVEYVSMVVYSHIYECTDLCLYFKSVFICVAVYVCVCVFWFVFLPGVKVSHYTVAQGTFYSVDAEMVLVFLVSSAVNRVTHMAALINQAHASSHAPSLHYTAQSSRNTLRTIDVTLANSCVTSKVFWSCCV